jgi:hypothetical protein
VCEHDLPPTKVLDGIIAIPRNVSNHLSSNTR